ncbi:MAG TPA: SIS domain-containing protein [Dermatophilaceae bacterium]|jgi:fructoselysine-6-P-deglycase FrlB-like protein
MLFTEGIAAQPNVLARSAKSIRDALNDLPLPRPGEVIALVGIGASEYAAASAAPVWRDQGLRAFAVSASQLLKTATPFADLYVGLSESGRSAETVAALSQLAGTRRVGLTNFADSPLVAVVEEALYLDSGPDSPVYTTGYTATLQALGLLGEHWSGQATDWSGLPEMAATVLTVAAPFMADLSSVLAGARIVDVVASGASISTAGEGALMLRESARLLTASHETYNYLHGPMEPLDPQTACVIIGDGREVRLALETSELGCPTLLITTGSDIASSKTLTVMTLPQASSPLAQAVLEILPLQLLGWAVASDRGLAVDGFRYHQDDTKLS